MPAYNIYLPPTAVLPGDIFYFFGSAPDVQEVVADTTKSRQFVMSYPPSAVGAPNAMGVDFHFAAAPTAPSLQVQVSNVDKDADYITIYDSSTDANAGQNWHVDLPVSKYKFVRCVLTAANGGGNLCAVATR